MAKLLTPTLLVLVPWVGGIATPLTAQNYREYTLVRNRSQPYRTLFQIRAGYRGVDPEGENLATGQTDDAAFDGFLLYHSKDFVRGEDWEFDFFAGIDGVYVGLKDQYFPGKRSQSRIELFGRPKAFFREGFYQNDDYLTVGQYEGSDYGVKIATAQALDKGLLFDVGLFFRKNEFSRNGQTRVDFEIPDDYNAYGIALTLEQNTLVLDRNLGVPQSGMLMSVAVENERNDSNRTWGSSSTYTSSLPSEFWRGELRAEVYFPNGRTGVWEILVDGGYYDTADRVTSYHAEHVQGHLWGDSTLGYRMAFGSSFFVKPFAQFQYAKVLQSNGVSADDETFWGGGVDMSFVFNQNMALVLNYSYVNNPSRPPAGLDNDNYGEHQFFIGMDVSFGSGYR